MIFLEFSFLFSRWMFINQLFLSASVYENYYTCVRRAIAWHNVCLRVVYTRSAFPISICRKAANIIWTQILYIVCCTHQQWYSVHIPHVCLAARDQRKQNVYKQEFVYLENVIENSAFWVNCGYTNRRLSNTAYIRIS